MKLPREPMLWLRLLESALRIVLLVIRFFH